MQDWLIAHEGLWRPSPYRTDTLGWTERYPALASALMALSDAEVDALANDRDALIAWLATRESSIGGPTEHLRVPRSPTEPLAPEDPHRTRDIPGRKLDQIRAFLAAVGRPQRSVLDWCAGKGHLGRLVCLHHAVPVTSLEIDARLCEAGADLAHRHRVPLHDFQPADALSAAARSRLAGRHTLALHACGELHRVLVRGVIATEAPALDLAPCCYHRGATGDHTPLNPHATLRLRREDLRLAVSDTVTAASREVRQRRLTLAWRLAARRWSRSLGIEPETDALPRAPDSGHPVTFTEYLQQLDLPVPPGQAGVANLVELERTGWRLEAKLRRLALPRLAFRRALELWLVLDLALALEQHGYAVTLGEWCERPLTPRNLLLSARRLT